MARFELRESDFSFNASLDPYMVLKKMGFTDHSMYQEGDIVRVHCPIHKDLVRKSLIIDTLEKTFKCQYANCDAHEGGLLIELVALYYDCDIRDVSKALFGEEDKSADLLFRGEMFINQGRHMDALPYLEQASDLNPRDEITRCKLAALYLELNRKDDAYREYLNAAESYAVRGELDKTLSIYNILIMLQPGAVKARKELSFLFSRMGRPDAAAEQLKWVVDFYMKYNQQKGAQEACEQIVEMDPENGMAYYLMGKLLAQTGKRVPAVQNFEKSCRLFIKAEDLNRADVSLAEALELAPGNGRLAELKEQLAEAFAALPPDQVQALQVQKVSASEEQEFIDWLQEVDNKLAMGEEARGSLESVRIGPDGLPLRAEAPKQPSANDTTEIAPEDRRVALCLNDMMELDSEQLEAMRQQLVSMFTEVRKSYEEGALADWEMRTIKEFYKAFCVAVDVHRNRAR
jgi:tetratricopeptide (TPR) repeat protein